MGLHKRNNTVNPAESSQTAGNNRRNYILETQPPFTPGTLAERWHWHQESVRRKFRRGEIAGMVVGRRILIPASEVARIEGEGMVARAV